MRITIRFDPLFDYAGGKLGTSFFFYAKEKQVPLDANRIFPLNSSPQL